MSGVGQNVSDRVRQEFAATTAGGDQQSAKRAAAAALGGLVGGVGQNVADLVRQEFGAARSEVLQSAKGAARGAGLLGGAAAAGHASVLFVGVALWRGLGNRIGYAKSALVVAALSGAAAVVLASNGTAELGRAQQASRDARQRAATVLTDDAPDGSAPPAPEGTTTAVLPTGVLPTEVLPTEPLGPIGTA
jgi:hypothetical protein